MSKISLVTFFVFVSTFGYSQKTELPKNSIELNLATYTESLSLSFRNENALNRIQGLSGLSYLRNTKSLSYIIGVNMLQRFYDERYYVEHKKYVDTLVYRSDYIKIRGIEVGVRKSIEVKPFSVFVQSQVGIMNVRTNTISPRVYDYNFTVCFPSPPNISRIGKSYTGSFLLGLKVPISTHMYAASSMKLLWLSEFETTTNDSYRSKPFTWTAKTLKPRIEPMRFSVSIGVDL